MSAHLPCLAVRKKAGCLGRREAQHLKCCSVCAPKRATPKRILSPRAYDAVQGEQAKKLVTRRGFAPLQVDYEVAGITDEILRRVNNEPASHNVHKQRLPE